MPYVDDDLEEEEVRDVADFEIEGSDLVLDMDEGDITVSDGDADTIDGEEALAQWIEKIFATRAHIYDIYDTEEPEEDEDGEEYDDEIDDEYGSRIKEIMLEPDTPRSYRLAQIQEEIENILQRHPDIIDVSEFEFEQRERVLYASFTVSTAYGETEEEVALSGTDS